ncbi:hypothetical protein QGM71_12510 [Virgibacillus sp. C22-A2]|uniref:Abortive infection protein-like C-terminal domain-containing protein n=1 Tax=Virgibacillus tibetensis TaxID=3042313 RepID=A0ABU6KHI3_9BACI|nr:hypothetical protein [Virgibacillus sp. C22-A2]
MPNTELRGEIIDQSNLKHDFEFVKEVLLQADTLISNHSYSSAVDRVHTALHGYLKELCDEQNIVFEEQNVKIQDMWGRLKIEHPSFNINVKEHQRPINQTVNAIAKFLENMNDIRNRHGLSHNKIKVPDPKVFRYSFRQTIGFFYSKVSKSGSKYPIIIQSFF